MRQSPRRPTAVVVLLALALGGTVSTIPSATATADRGDGAVARAADRYGVSEGSLRARLREDPSLRLTPAGAAYFIDPAAPPVAPAPVAAQGFPLAQTFQLHSKPGSPRTIFLDFNGHTVSGTAWNGSAGGNVPNGTHPAWDPDGGGAAFTDAEKLMVQDIFQRVAEDYAPFDVDVTTEDPGTAAIDRVDPDDQTYGTRALITPSVSAATAICSNTCGGVAFGGVFNHHPGRNHDSTAHWQYQPAWVFPQNLGPDDPKAIAEGVTHEVGHTLGLDHDATATQGYYEGHNGWVPIMGNAYNQPISQFALSDYPGAVLGGPNPPPNPLQPDPDDIVTITRHGAALRADEAPGSREGAGKVPAGTGYIRKRTDRDVYSLGACLGAVTVAADPAPVSPNLDIRLDLLAANGRVVASSNPPSAKVNTDLASGMDASINTSLPPGNYYVKVDGVGRGTATTGYTDYGSIGAYTLQVSGCGGVQAKPGKPRIGDATRGKRGGKMTAKSTWRPPLAAANPAINGYQVIAYRQNDNGSYVRVSRSRVLGAAKRSFVFIAGQPGSYKFAVRARNGLGFGRKSAKSNAVRPR